MNPLPPQRRLCAALVTLLALATGAGRGDAPVVGAVGSCWPGAPGTDPTLCPPNDPDFVDRWELRSDIPRVIDRAKMHPAEAALGAIGMSVDSAWQLTLGRDDVVDRRAGQRDPLAEP